MSMSSALANEITEKVGISVSPLSVSHYNDLVEQLSNTETKLLTLSLPKVFPNSSFDNTIKLAKEHNIKIPFFGKHNFLVRINQIYLVVGLSMHSALFVNFWRKSNNNFNEKENNAIEYLVWAILKDNDMLNSEKLRMMNSFYDEIIRVIGNNCDQIKSMVIKRASEIVVQTMSNYLDNVKALSSNSKGQDIENHLFSIIYDDSYKVWNDFFSSKHFNVLTKNLFC